MPRTPRAEFEPGFHHVFARGNRKQEIYLDDADRRRYIAMLGYVVSRMNWWCLGYCLMGNHMHLLVETTAPNLGRGMHRLHGNYAQYFNRRHRLVGHLFQDRFEAVPIVNDAQVTVTARYIARNPVEAKLCRQAGDWPWSSHATVLNGSAPTWLAVPRLFDYFAAGGGDPRRRYKDFVEAIAEPKGDSPL